MFADKIFKFCIVILQKIEYNTKESTNGSLGVTKPIKIVLMKGRIFRPFIVLEIKCAE